MIATPGPQPAQARMPELEHIKAHSAQQAALLGFVSTGPDHRRPLNEIAAALGITEAQALDLCKEIERSGDIYCPRRGTWRTTDAYYAEE